jgi:hypothetical protein
MDFNFAAIAQIEHGFRELRRQAVADGLRDLHDAIEAAMELDDDVATFDEGYIDEVSALLDRGMPLGAAVMQLAEYE